MVGVGLDTCAIKFGNDTHPSHPLTLEVQHPIERWEAMNTEDQPENNGKGNLYLLHV